MRKFEQTRLALVDFKSTQQFDFGAHPSNSTAVGVPGQSLGEIPFDADKHSLLDIEPFSMMGEMLDAPHVLEVQPERPMIVNLVIDRSPSDDLEEVVLARQQTMDTVGQDIVNPLREIADRLFVYEVDTQLRSDEQHNSPIFIKAENDPLVTAKKVAELCINGLTFVLSDFTRLPIEKTMTRPHPIGMIGVKVNHIADLQLPLSDNKGRRRKKVIVSLGHGRSVDLSNTDEVLQVNRELYNQDRAIVARLERAGLAVADAVFSNHPQSGFGFDIEHTDAVISQAIRTLSDPLGRPSRPEQGRKA